MNFAEPYADLREFIVVLDVHRKLYRIDKEINKDTELQPLVRWQYRGGIAEQDRAAFCSATLPTASSANTIARSWSAGCRAQRRSIAWD
jgi:hypothetical protein